MSQTEGYRSVLLDTVTLTLQSGYWYLIEGEPPPWRETG